MSSLFFFWYGFYTLASQVLLIREMAVVTMGHEIAVGAALAAWLFWTGLGSSSRSTEKTFPIAVGFLAVSMPLSILIIRLSKTLVPQGNLPGIFISIALPFVALALPCWFSGAVFSSGIQAVRSKSMSPGRVYFLESAGALAGGAFSVFFFLKNLPPILAVFTGGIVLIALSRSIVKPSSRALSLLTNFAVIGMVLCSSRLETWSRAVQWKGYELIADRQTPYEHAALARVQGTTVFFENGIVSAQFPDPASREETAHWALLAHPKPEKILVIGFEGIFALPEILKHPVGSVDILNPDPDALEMVRNLIPSLNDPRVAVHKGDSRRWIREHPGSYDVILQTLPDPQNSSLNRFFTEEFFSEAQRSLRTGGLAAFRVASSENYLPPEVLFTNASILRAASKSFKTVRLIPGSRMTVLAGEDLPEPNAGTFKERFEKRRIKTVSFAPALFPYALHPNRSSFLRMRLNDAASAPSNSDLVPVSLYQTWRVTLLKFASPAVLMGLAAAVLAAGFLFSKLLRMSRAWMGTPETLLLASIGFAGMALETAALFIFQSVSGALFWQIGILLASFMLGLAAGSAFTSLIPVRKNLAVMILPALGLGILCAVLSFKIPLLFSFKDPLIAFGVLLVSAGFLTGAAFPLASKSREEQSGNLYASDLIGSALGAFAAGTFLIPLLGHSGTFAVSAGAAFLGLILFLTFSALQNRPS